MVRKSHIRIPVSCAMCLMGNTTSQEMRRDVPECPGIKACNMRCISKSAREIVRRQIIRTWVPCRKSQ